MAEGTGEQGRVVAKLLDTHINIRNKVEDMKSFLCNHPIASLISVTLIYEGVIVAWGKPRPIADFFENVIANILRFGVPLGVIALSIWAWEFINERTKKAWIAWVSAIFTFVVLGGHPITLLI